MYVRLSVQEKDRVSGVGMGLFTAMGILSRKRVLLHWEMHLYDETLAWFAKHLLVPRPPAGGNFYARPMAVSWFKDSASTHILRFRQLALILESHGVRVTQFSTDRPGKIEYEDDYQIAAVPFRDTFAAGT